MENEDKIYQEYNLIKNCAREELMCILESVSSI